MKNIIIFCLINSLASSVARDLCEQIDYNYIDLSKTFEEKEINSKTDLNIVAENSDSAKISIEQLKIISRVKNTVFVSNNFNLLSEKFLNNLKGECSVVYIAVNKIDYLEHKWNENLTQPTKFKVDDIVFEMRQKAYISCVDICLSGSTNAKTLSKKLIKKLESL